MTETIMQCLVEMIKQGGQLAIWGIFIWVGFSAVKVVSVVLGLVVIVRLVMHTIHNCYKINKETQSQRIHILSESISSKLEKSLDEFQSQSISVLKELQKELEELSKRSGKK